MATPQPTLRVRINQIDHCMAKPGNLDNGECDPNRLVPIIRVFGSTDHGVPACVHIHQVYPYLFVSYAGGMDPRDTQKFSSDLRQELHNALVLAAKTNARNTHFIPSRFVKKVILVKGVDLYGFHSTYKPFFKIYLYDPTSATRAANLLRSGAVMGQRFTVYEAHLNFPLQFMCDFALYGCNWLELGDVFERGDTGVSPYAKQTRMRLEVDACAHQVLNRHVLTARNLHDRLTIPAPPPAPEPLISSVRELWDDERRRRAEKGLPPSPEMPSVLSQGSRGAGGGWRHEAQMWTALRTRIAEERPWAEPKTEAWADYVATTFESIDALWDREHQTFTCPEPASELTSGNPRAHKAVVPVDALLISSQVFQDELQRAERDAWFGGEDRYMTRAGVEDDAAPEDPFWSDEDDVLPAPKVQRPAASTKESRNLHQEQTPAQIFDDFSRESQESNPFTPSDRPRKRARVDPEDDAWASFGVAPRRRLTNAQPNCFEYAQRAPTTKELLATLPAHNLRHTLYRDPFYSNPLDAPTSVYENQVSKLRIDLRGGIGEWNDGVVWRNRDFQLHGRGVHGWEYAGAVAPRRGKIRRWLQKEADEGGPATRSSTSSQQLYFRSQIEGPTQVTQSQPHGPAGVRDSSNMSVLALEVFVPTKGDKKPDSATDPIRAVFYAFLPGNAPAFEDAVARRRSYTTGIIAVRSANVTSARLRDYTMEVVESELELLNRLVDRVVELDPDIVSAWEVQTASWGYVRARGKDIYGLDVLDLVGRADRGGRGQGSDTYNNQHASIIRVTGRHVLNVWRILRVDMTLLSYSFENVVFHVLKRRVPNYSARTLTEWMASNLPMHNSRVLQYFADRTACVLDLLDETETVNKNAEFARVFGIDFFSVLHRGSQYKVESFLFRMAKPESYLIMSPSREDVGRQNAIYATPLILEPMAAFYSSPLVVLDFQSLYPSVMIAYNLCYTTCLGRVEQQNGHWKLGVLPDFELPPGLLGKLEDYIHIAPNGLMFVKPEVRSGVLGRMLRELLDTRIMVKQAMKSAKGDKGLHRTLDARQLSLKFICNVTYGYTSATFSGRMPAVEIADSIVQTGRETLEKAMATIHNTAKWGAKVVYGDTDSLFVYLPGRTKEQAFRIGYDIADTITAMNPDPIKLKFEKVYLPSVLMAKKRYVGFKYETPDEVEPVFEAKGIETVRRDFVPATQKMMETSIKMLFRSQDLSEVKDYCIRSWMKIFEERVSLQDFIFAKEVRMGTYSDRQAPPAGVMVAARQQLDDPNDEAQYGDRIKYLIPRRNKPNERLVERAVNPYEFLRARMHIDAEYYVERMLVRPLARVFGLIGVDVRAWYKQMPKTQRVERADPTAVAKERIDAHFASALCISCGHAGFLKQGVCVACRKVPAPGVSRLEKRIRAIEKREREAELVCATCTGSRPGEEIKCESLDCSWFFERHKVARDAEALPDLHRAVNALLDA